MHKLLLKLIVLGLLVVTPIKSHAVSTTWAGGHVGALNDWSTKQNWSANTIPTGADDAVFAGTVTQMAPTLTVDSTINTITFSSGAGAYTIAGAGRILTINNGIVNSSATAQSFTVATISLGSANQAWAATAGNLSISSAVSLNTRTLTLNAAAAKTITLSSGVSGTGGVTSSGAGQVTLSGANTFTGPLSVSAGTFIASSAGSLGSAGSHASAINVSGGTLQFNAISSSLTTPVNLSGGTLKMNNIKETFGALTVSGSSILDLTSGNNWNYTTFASATRSAGTLTINNWANVANRDRIFVTSAPTSTFLNNVNFTGFGTGAQMVGTELVPSGTTPVPEPQEFAAVFGIGLLVFAGYRRRVASRTVTA